VNSLEGIADDLTALPFTLQDVKSEDGETPPPSLPSAPSRMSIHEVTRAFQQVPTSSSTPSLPPHRASFSPPSTHAPVARPTTAVNYAYSPAPQNNLRPAYVYPSPMMSHSPGPIMYGHPMASSPVPSRMQVNGHTPLYSQPMWMTMPGPSPQGHSNMMRSVPSPYPSQMVHYPSAGYAPQPPSNMMPTTPQGQNGRGRGMPPVMSPVMSHAHAHPGSAMYGSSPVMLHAVQAPQNHGYMPMPTGRGQPRTENGQLPNPQPQHPPNSHHLQQHGGFNSGPNSFAGPAW
jgi:serine/arginine repetitive matrix protein 2